MGFEGAKAKFSFKPRATLLLKWRVNTRPRPLGAGRSILGSNVVKSPSTHMGQPRGPTMTGSIAISVADLQPPTGVARGSCRPGTSILVDICPVSQLQLLLEGSFVRTSNPVGCASVSLMCLTKTIWAAIQ